MSLFHAGLQPALDSNGNPISGATWTFYLSGTLTPTAVYADASLNTSLGSSETANGAGRFAVMFIDDSIATRAILRDAGGTTIEDIDPINGEESGDGSGTLADAIAATIDADIDTITTTGYYTVGDGGGATYERAASEPTHEGKFQSADGAWWEMVATSANVLAFGAKGIGLAFDDTAFIQDAIDYGLAKGCDVVFPANITDFYNVTVCLIVWPGVSLRGIGGLAKIRNYSTTVGSRMYRTLLLTGNLALNYVERLTLYDCGTINPGNSVTLVTLADAANLEVGEQVITRSNAFRLIGGSEAYEYLHLNRVEAINGAVITLKYPIDTSYAGGICKLSEITTDTDQPIDIPLFFAENSVVEYLDLEAPDGIFPANSALYNVTFQNCIMKGRWTIYGNCFQHCKVSNIQGYFSERIGEFAENSLDTHITNSTFSFYPDATISAPTTPEVRFQMGEASRKCSISNCTINLNDLDAAISTYVVSFNDVQYCSASHNKITGRNASSQIIPFAFAGRTEGLRCCHNRVSDNHVDLSNVRLFAYFLMVDDSNFGNVVEGNTFNALTGDFAYSVRFDNSTGNILRGNISNFGAIFFNDTSSAENTVTDNFFPLGFGTHETSTNDAYFQKNTLANNASLASQVKQTVLAVTNATISAPASTTTAVLDRNIGTSLAARDSYQFQFFVVPTGTANTKPVVFNLRNNTDAADLNIFSHDIPAASTGLQVFTVTVRARNAAAGIYCYTTVYDATADTTETYVAELTRPAADKDLSFILNATPGASTSLSFRQITANFSNPYQRGISV